MKRKLLYLFSAMALTLVFQGCHDPKELTSNGDPRGIISLTAKYAGDDSSENSFDSQIDYENHTITVRIPMYYPKASFNEVTPDDLKNMRLVASLSNNSTIEPALTTLDLSKDNIITVKNPQGVRTQYTVRAEIVELWECDIIELELADGTTGIVDEKNHRVTLVATDLLEPQKADVILSPHATISPDIINEPFDFEQENITLTVTAHNGVDKKEYTVVKGAPEKIPFGFREGSEQLRWVKKWNEIGYTLKDKQTGFGVTDRYLVLNEKGNMQAVVLKASNGTDTGKRLDMSIIPTGMNHNMTSDHAGHILVNSKYGDGENLIKIWVFDDIDSKGRLLLSANCYGAGERISVYGDVTKDAVIVTTLNGTNITGYRWFVRNGVVDKNGEQFNLAGVASTPWGNVDIAPTSATSNTANYYAAFYALVNGTRGPVQYNGATNAVMNIGYPNTKKRDDADGGIADAGNWVINACDYREFNKSKFFIHNSVNTFPWGGNDFIYMIDVSGGDLKNEILKTNENHGAVKFVTDGEDGIYGAKAAGGVGAGGNANDVRLWVSDTGFYMYGYFLFTNGYMGCIRVDCIQY
ncbi:MAG: DUF5018 domain-containing protein [Clostridiales bacterium]|nr:DUF5018 domain-containing protein [Clostridiales bacterium]